MHIRIKHFDNVNYSLNYCLRYVYVIMNIATYNNISASPTYPTGGSYCEGPGSVGSVGETHTPGQAHFVVK